MSFDKENFLRTKFIGYLQRIDPATEPVWGQMTVQHMIEHFGNDAVRVANGRLKIETILTPPAKLPRWQEFLMSSKPFTENLKNPLLPDTPPAFRHKTIQAAIGELHQELIYFFEVFEQQPALQTRNPFFGDLNFEQNVRVLYKHALHHLRQFGVVPLDV